jgi:hypothetical protein
LEKDVVWVLVDLNQQKCFVLPSKTLEKIANDGLRRYLDKANLGSKPEEHPNWVYIKEVKEHENKWETLEL